MAGRVANSHAVKLWMASQAICKQAALRRCGGVRPWSGVSMFVLAEEVRCWRVQVPAAAFKQLRSWSYWWPSRILSGPVVAGEIFADVRRLFGGSALEEGERLHSRTRIRPPHRALSMDAIVNVVGNNITAETTLNDLNLELKWSDIGKFPVNLLQPTLRTVISRVVLPILNEKLAHDFPLAVLPAIDLENADIRYEEGPIFICCDVYYN